MIKIEFITLVPISIGMIPRDREVGLPRGNQVQSNNPIIMVTPATPAQQLDNSVSIELAEVIVHYH